MKDKKKYLMWGGCILLVLIVIGVGIFTGYKLYESGNVTDDDVDETVYTTSTDSSQFAIWITGVGEYTGSGWPSSDDYEFDSASSYCIDSEGNKDYGVISYENEKVKFYTTSFKSCTIYFKESKVTNLTQAYNKWTDIDTIIDSDGTDDIEDIWESTLTGDGYRYVGTDPDNYICFGTDDVDTCTSNPSKYMYRIIGIFADSSGNYHLKLIKMEALDTAYYWYYSTTAQNKDWKNTTLYSGLNGSYYLTNSSYMTSTTWSNMITTWTWTSTNTKTNSYDGYSYSYSTAGQMYTYSTTRTVYYHETRQTNLITDSCFTGGSNISNCTTADNATCFKASCSAGVWTTVNAKIGLMYVSDYLLSLGSSALTKTSGSYTSTFKTGWMHLSNNDSDAPYSYEWTIDRMGYYYGDIYYDLYNYYNSSKLSPSVSNASVMLEYNYVITSTGRVDARGYGMEYSVRPVFYLNNSVTIIDGIGSIDDPYILEA